MDVAARVGLQLLIDPGASSAVFAAGCATVGVIYPAYQSFKALESNCERRASGTLTRVPSYADDEQWLTYWSVYGLFSLIELKSEPLLRNIPYYHHVKFGFLLWLMMPQTQGAKLLYQSYLQPILRRYSPKIDVVISHVTNFAMALYQMYQVPISAAAAAAWSFITWFTDVDNDKSGKDKAAGSAKPSQFVKG